MNTQDLFTKYSGDISNNGRVMSSKGFEKAIAEYEANRQQPSAEITETQLETILFSAYLVGKDDGGAHYKDLPERGFTNWLNDNKPLKPVLKALHSRQYTEEDMIAFAKLYHARFVMNDTHLSEFLNEYNTQIRGGK